MRLLEDAARYAARHGRLRLLRIVVALGANINAVDVDGETALHHAIRFSNCNDEEDEEEVRELVRVCGAAVSVVRASPPKSHVRLAIELGKVAALRALAATLPAAFPQFVDNCGETMLFWAVESGQVGTARYLLEQGCDVHAASKYAGDNVLGRAVAKAGLEVVALLVDGGYGADVRGPVASGQLQPLHIAALRGAADVAALLIARGAAVDGTDARGATPLHMSVDVGVTSLLLQHGASIDAADAVKQTALYRAAAKGNLTMAQHLLRNGATVDAPDAQGETPFRAAVENGHLQLAAVLLAHGAAIDAQDHCGFSSVHECAYMGHMEALAFLLARGADVNLVSAVGKAPLDVAATCVRRNRRGEVARLLVENGARPSPFLASPSPPSSSLPVPLPTTPVLPQRSQRNFACFVSNLENTHEDTDDEDD